MTELPDAGIAVREGAEAERALGVLVDLADGSSAAATDPELVGAPRRDSDSRFKRFRSARISAAL
jgi:hypothetical protein